MHETDLTELLQELEHIDEQRAKVELTVLDQLLFVDREVANSVIEVFNEHSKAAAWLANKCLSLGNEKPLSLLVQGKRGLVLDCLGRIKHGMWA